MDLIESALDLGKMISKSEEYINLKECEALIMSDNEAIQLLNDLRILQSEFVKAKKDNLGDEALDSLMHIIEMKQDEIYEYRPTGLFFKAKKEFDALMKEISNKILEGVTGQPTSCGGDCSGCKSCAH